MADDVPSTFVVPDPFSASSSEEEAPQSAQKQKADTESDQESMSDSELTKCIHFKDTTALPDLCGSGDEEDDDPSESLAKDMADELVADNSDADEEAPVALAQPRGKGKHPRPDKAWFQVQLWKTEANSIAEIIEELKELAQSLYDESGTCIPKSEYICCHVHSHLLLFSCA
jgi:hypothetical protein